jgi:FkbM family methyltransferase
MSTWDRLVRVRPEQMRAVLRRVRDVLPGGFGRTSFAQEGEDLILERMFEHQAAGTYVDVGAHHPQRFSNTHLLYRRGWHGVNIDATPGSMRPFAQQRPRDVNLECGVAATEGVQRFFVFDEPALNTFDAARARSLEQTRYQQTGVHDVRCAPLSMILREHAIGAVDLLTIDVEGYDFEVLQTVDWTAHAPRVVLIEQLGQDLEAVLQTETYRFMSTRHYRLAAKTFNSVFYVRDQA